MAQKIQVLLVDDMDGGVAAETVSFAIDGNPYEIDLSAANAAMLRASLADYVAHARRPSPGAAQSRSPRAARAVPLGRIANKRRRSASGPARTVTR